MDSEETIFTSSMPNLHPGESGRLALPERSSPHSSPFSFFNPASTRSSESRGNLDWLTGHFAKSPLAGMVPAMVTAITILELAAGALSAIGCVFVVLTHNSTVAFYGAMLAAISIISLFFGQRMAKDYAGAATLVPTFLLALIAIYLLS